MERPPETARYVAIAQLAAAVLIAVIGVVGGVLMQVELAEPGPKWSVQFYSKMLTFHDLTPLALGAAPLVGGLGYLAIAKLLGANRIPAPALAWVAFGVWMVGVIALVIATAIVTSDTGWTLYTPYTLGGVSSRPWWITVGPLAVAASATLYAVHLAIVVIAHRAATLNRVIAGAIVLVAAAAGIVGLRAAFATESLATNTPAVVLGLALATSALAGSTSDRKASQVLVSSAIGVAVVWVVIPHVVIALALAAIWIALAIINGFGRPAVAFVVFGCAPAIVLHGLANGMLTSPVDLHFHDTHVAVGALHLVMAVVGFGALAGLHTWPVIARTPNPIVAWIGGCVCSGGLLLHVFSSIAVGHAGMPRRYWDYDPVHTAHHALSLWGVGVLLVGVVLIALAWFVGRRPRLTS